ncbi:MAG TPA: 2-hydroxychromene-2-carboxylate isomerase [Nevskiaceae bacterium]|nr:2-hydroxychromene-2-carboxylate isomerase [Nevskiaceae bacterium]
MSATVEFFWDPASPYTYLAATQIEALAARHGARVQWKPFLIGKAFEATGNKMPATVPAKAQYMFKDLQLWSRHYQVPFRFPKQFPINGITAMRMACALPEAAVGAFALAVMRAYWAEGADITQNEVLQALAGGLGHDGPALLARTQEPEVKERLKTNTEEAIRRGAFGAPSLFVGERLFWGNDRLGLLEEVLAGRL